MKQLIIKEMESGQRLDKFLGKYLKEAPKSFIYKMLRKKNITLKTGRRQHGKRKTENRRCGEAVFFRGNAGKILRTGKTGRKNGFGYCL